MKKRKIPVYDLIFAAAMLALLPFFIWKCRYGYGGCDEPFYLTLAQRLSKGDALLCDEWNLSQLSGFLLLPFYRLHQLIAGSTEGIVLHFRYLYTGAQLLTALLLYGILRRHRLGGAFAALVFAAFTPYDIMALSYNTMALMAVTLCLALLSCSEPRARFGFALAGLCYGAAVIANPYLIVLYLFYLSLFLAACLIRAAAKNKAAQNGRLFSTLNALFPAGPLLFFTLGGAVLAVVFALFVFSRADLGSILRNLEAILDDPEHAARSLRDVIYSFLYVMRKTFGSFLAVWLLLTVLALTDLRKRRHAWMYFCMTALVTAIAVMIHIPAIQTDYHYIMFPITMCGLTAYLLTREKNHRVFLFLWCFGMLYAFCLGWASNQGDNAICMGMPAAAAGSVLLIHDFVMESLAPLPEQTTGRAGRFTAPLVICTSLLLLLAQLGAECYAKAVHAFWEPSVSALDTQLTQGPLAGVITTQEHADAYRTLLAELDGYREDKAAGKKGPVLLLTSSPWCYLYVDRPYGTYSSWTTFYSSSAQNSEELLLDRLGDYFYLHPERYPADIYIAKNDLLPLWTPGGAEVDADGGCPLAGFLLQMTNDWPSALFPPDSGAWKVRYAVEETAHGYHLHAADTP